MKKLSLFFTVLFVTARLVAQTNSVPVRLGLIVESSEASTVGDVLTAELSKNGQIHLLERAEIEKVYREQGLSAGNKDYLKLGQILGADGLWLFDVVRTPQATNLTARLIAVKPGVVLLEENFSWPLANVTEWASSVANHVNPILPKLTVLVKDAIPISVVNLRSAVQSADALETERQLKLLTIQRLSRERQLFVLERQRMQLLSEEKSLKGMDDSAFWNGSYLLEGVVDQNGYSKGIVTINARLTPPKGGTAIPIEVSGSRTNLAEVINQLAVKVNEALKVASTVKEWNAADEAQQYFVESKWAMRWGIYSEAQMAAESAWALGKHDKECAEMRARAYMVEIDTGGYEELTLHPKSLQYITNVACGFAPDRPWGLVLSEQVWRPNITITYAYAKKYPDIKNMDRSIRALEVYQEFSQTLPPDNLKTNSAWFGLGVEDLTIASRVLQHFHFVHSSQEPAAEKLAQLRSLARSVAEWISKSPSVRDTYWVRNSTTAGDESANTRAPQKIISREPSESLSDNVFHRFPDNIFSCEVIWGCFWQEKPEDCVALYRELMSSPAFRQIHHRLWFRDGLTMPRLTAWNEEDRKHIPTVWNDFIQELNNSTNRLFQIEAKASTLNKEQLQDKDGEGWLTIEPTKNDEAFYKEIQYLKDQNPFGSWNEQKPINPVEFLAAFQFRDYSIYQARKIKSLLDSYEIRLNYQAKNASGEDKVKLLNGVSLVESLQSDVRRILNASAEAEAAQKNLAAFEKQKLYLKENKPFNSSEFVKTFLFGFKDYSNTQALEIQPLLAAYKSNLVAQVNQSPRTNSGSARIGIMQVGRVEDNVNRILSAPDPKLGADSVQSKLAAFEKQKQYLKDNKLYEPQEFAGLFISGFNYYSKAQALEIQPLLAAYKTNLTGTINGHITISGTLYKTNLSGTWAQVRAIQVGQAEDNVNRILNPPAPKPKVAVVQSTNPAPIQVAPTKVVSHVAEKPPEIVTNILAVKNYLKIPKDRVAARYVYSMGISSHRWSGGKLLFDLRYEGTEKETFVGGERANGNKLAAIAIFDPANETWQVVEYPSDIEFPQENSPYAFGSSMNYLLDGSVELFQGNLYLSFSDQIHKYDFKTRQWQVLDFPGQKRSKLFAIDGHLYAANNETIIEIMDDGKGTRLMASTRRRPVASALDSLDGLGSPILFSSSNHLVCAIIYNTTIFSWDDKDWHQVLTLDISQYKRQSPESFDEGFIFRSSSRSDQTDLWVVKKDLSAPELWLQDKPKPQPGVYNNGMNKPDNSSLRLVKSPKGNQLASSVATLFKSNLYFLVDHSIATNKSGLWTATEKDGYNAKLVCWSRDGLEPLVVPLKIDLEQGQPSMLMNVHQPQGQMSLVTESTWMCFAGDNLYIGQSETLGIWAIPIAEIEAAIAAQKQVMLAKKHQDAEAMRQLQEKVMAKYDHNHNGIIDPDEKEEALDDPAFIESELDVMDANHNGRLDPEELVYFDANTNKILEAKEQAGFDIAQHLLAVKLLKKFDANGDGLLDRREFDDLLQPIFAVNTLSSSSLSFPDQNRDGQVGLGELELFLNQQTRGGLRVRRSPLAISKQIGADPNKPIDSKQIFKTTVEAYWQNPGSITNRPPFNRMPPGRVVVTNGTQSGKVQ